LNDLIQHIVKLKCLLILSSLILVSGNLMGQSRLSKEERTIAILVEEAEENWHKDIPKAQKAAHKAFLMLNSETAPELRAEAHAQYGISFYTDLNYDSAIFYYKKATNIAFTNNLAVNKYTTITTSAMQKTGRFMDVIKLVEQRINQLESREEEYFNLLMIKLSASIALGSTEKSDSIIQVLDNFTASMIPIKSSQKFNKLKAKYLHLTAQYDKSDSIFNQLLNNYLKDDDKMGIADVYLLLARNAMEISQYKRSSNFLLKSKAIYDSLGYEFGKANINLFTGSLLSWMGQYNDASDYIFKSLKVFEKNNNQNEAMIAHYELGWIFYSMKMEERAKKYLNLSLKIAQNISNIKYLGNIHNAYGSLFTDLEKYDSAIYHFDSAIYYQKITKNIRSIAAAKFNKAVVLEKLGKNKKALQLYRYGYKVDEKLSNTIGLIEGDWVLGKYFMKNNQLDSAQYYFNLGESRALELEEKHFLLRIYEAQASLSSDNGNHQMSSDYLRKALLTQKELSKENKMLELATLETTYDLKNKEKELSLLNLQKKNNEQTIESQRNTLIVLSIGILVLLILSYIIFRYLKIRTKTNRHLKELYNEIQEKQEEILAQSEELKEANDRVHELNDFLEKRVKERTQALQGALSELDFFFYRASHDFRGPLTTLLGLVGISKGFNLSDEAVNIFNKVDVTVKKLDSMVKKLQAVSFLGDFENLRTPKLIALENDIRLIAEEVIKNKSFDGFDYNYDLNINTSDESITFYPAILDICLRNLIENSLIFNHSEIIKINISATVKENQLILSVEDNGIGISQDMQKYIYNMFKRTSQISTGNGLGLYIVKKATDILNGHIQLESNTHKGSTFVLRFPLSGIEQESKKETNKVAI